MKKIFAILTLFFAGGAFFAKDMAINSSEKKKDYKASLSVSPMNEGVTVSEKVIVFQPKKEGVEYTISGYVEWADAEIPDGSIAFREDSPSSRSGPNAADRDGRRQSSRQ